MKEYIEREAVLKHLDECRGTPPEMCYSYPIFTALKCFVEDIPAADVVEVRHGRWDDSGRYKFPNGETAVCCTECGCALRKKEYENSNWFYCPVCGAKMDKEE